MPRAYIAMILSSSSLVLAWYFFRIVGQCQLRRERQSKQLFEREVVVRGNRL